MLIPIIKEVSVSTCLPLSGSTKPNLRFSQWGYTHFYKGYTLYSKNYKDLHGSMSCRGGLKVNTHHPINSNP